MASAGWLRGAAALVAVAGALGSVGCSEPDEVVLGDPGHSPTGAVTAPTAAGPRVIREGTLTLTLPVITDPADEAVLAGYQAFWGGLLKASANADPAEASLMATTTGGARPFFGNYLAKLRLLGRTQSGPVGLRPTVGSATATVATVVDCADLSGLRVRDRSGKPVYRSDLQTTQLRVELLSQGTRWLVRSYSQTGRGCRPGA